MSRIKIHELDVYSEQITCADKIMKIFNESNAAVLLVAQMQQGKTGTVVCVINKFIELCRKEHKSYEIIYLINLSDNDIKEQTEIRFIQSGLSDDITVLHHKNINSMQPSEVKLRLIIIDECHVALGKNKPLHNFMARCGVNYGNSIDTWENKNNYVLSVSATPYAHAIKTKIDADTFKPVILEMSSEYFSLQHMQKANRIKQAEPMVDSQKRVTPYFKERVKEFLTFCSSGEDGYLIVRTRNPGLQSISAYLKELQLQHSLSVLPFSCKNDNISRLDVYLKTRPKRPTIILISGSMRAGKTLTTTKHIRMWLDSHTSKPDTTCQSVGRCLGYPSNEYSKFDDKFPIYCCIREIDECIEFFDRYKCSPIPTIPRGNWNKKSPTTGGEYIALPFSTENEIRQAYPAGRATISVCSKNNEHSIALTVLNNSNRGYGSNDDTLRIYYIDEPSPNFTEDFKKLMNHKSYLRGKFVIYTPSSNIENNDIKNHLSKNSLFSESVAAT